MKRWRALLFCSSGVWGDGVRHLLGQTRAFTLISVLPLDPEKLASVQELQPDVIFVAEDKAHEEMQAFIAQLLEAAPDIPLVFLSLSPPRAHLIQARSLPSHWQRVLESVIATLQQQNPGATHAPSAPASPPSSNQSTT